MKKLILLLFVATIFSTPAMADICQYWDCTPNPNSAGHDGGQYAGQYLAGGITLGLAAQKTEAAQKHPLLATIAISTALVLTTDEGNERLTAIGGTMFGTFIGQNIWVKHNQDKTIAGVAFNW